MTPSVSSPGLPDESLSRLHLGLSSDVRISPSRSRLRDISGYATRISNITSLVDHEAANKFMDRTGLPGSVQLTSGAGGPAEEKGG
jgi:hypothetical protein